MLGLGGIRLLIVDDEPDTLELFRKLLSPYGAEVTTASSARQALEEIRKVLPDVLICDIGMPEHDGYSLIRDVRSLPPQSGGTIPAMPLRHTGAPKIVSESFPLDSRCRPQASGTSRTSRRNRQYCGQRSAIILGTDTEFGFTNSVSVPRITIKKLL
jgi:CheY-like chemotaxis protein